ncbi:FdhF/YdeP family oxidoreductase [Kordiimonas pumila]|uniref:FdhF/YdeP family oxidoreductase n=1 Tax=Kordiimonas pumila TaxID=2161677 RepID=A0ABV7D4Q9_9PROT|nr:FdhF/YdeP family oxidoreductase [Kordiimonas pumila]
MKQVVGGGGKKVLYTLNTIREMGVRKAVKALTSNNACKACGLGMGGQHGGMTNELDEFPSVCNKSVQAQSSDVQAAIPEALFNHTLHDFRQLDGYELEHMGRLNTPLYKAKDSDRYKPVTWDQALEIAARKFRETQPDRSFFYSSGRSSNEAGFLLQLFARVYGTNNVNNCSYYCHQATSVALGSTIGTGTATVELADLKKTDLVFVIGANPASNHPRFIHQLKAVRDRGGDVIVINPAREAGLVKFAVPKSPKSLISGGDEIASLFITPKIGTDIAVFKGIAKALLENGAIDTAFITEHTNGFDAFRVDIETTSWASLSEATGVGKDTLTHAAKIYAQSKSAVFAWGMGMTHHQHGCNNIEYIAALSLLRGMVGKEGAGLLPLRGHSNVQGIGTIGVKPVLPEEVFALIEKEFDIKLPKTEGFHTLAGLEAADKGLIDAALIMGGNLYEATPDSVWAEKTLDKIGFKLFLTTTLNAGHFHGHDTSETIILPVTARDEEWQPTTQESMFNYVRLSDGGINRLSSVRPETLCLADLAVQVLPNTAVPFANFKNHSELRKAIAATVPGLEALADIDVAKKEFHIQGRVMHTQIFNTPDGKATFHVHAVPDTAQQGFLLTTVRSEGQFNSIIYERADSYRPAKDRWSVMMNADDMAHIGVVDGGTATIKSATGVMAGVKVHAYDIAPGSIMAYYPEANILTARTIDKRSKTPNFKSIPVTIEKAA